MSVSSTICEYWNRSNSVNFNPITMSSLSPSGSPSKSPRRVLKDLAAASNILNSSQDLPHVKDPQLAPENHLVVQAQFSEYREFQQFRSESISDESLSKEEPLKYTQMESPLHNLIALFRKVKISGSPAPAGNDSSNPPTSQPESSTGSITPRSSLASDPSNWETPSQSSQVAHETLPSHPLLFTNPKSSSTPNTTDTSVLNRGMLAEASSVTYEPSTPQMHAVHKKIIENSGQSSIETSHLSTPPSLVSTPNIHGNILLENADESGLLFPSMPELYPQNVGTEHLVQTPLAALHSKLPLTPPVSEKIPFAVNIADIPLVEDLPGIEHAEVTLEDIEASKPVNATFEITTPDVINDTLTDGEFFDCMSDKSRRTDKSPSKAEVVVYSSASEYDDSIIFSDTSEPYCDADFAPNDNTITVPKLDSDGISDGNISLMMGDVDLRDLETTLICNNDKEGLNIDSNSRMVPDNIAKNVSELSEEHLQNSNLITQHETVDLDTTNVMYQSYISNQFEVNASFSDLSNVNQSLEIPQKPIPDILENSLTVDQLRNGSEHIAAVEKIAVNIELPAPHLEVISELYQSESEISIQPASKSRSDGTDPFKTMPAEQISPTVSHVSPMELLNSPRVCDGLLQSENIPSDPTCVANSSRQMDLSNVNQSLEVPQKPTPGILESNLSNVDLTVDQLQNSSDHPANTELPAPNLEVTSDLYETESEISFEYEMQPASLSPTNRTGPFQPKLWEEIQQMVSDGSQIELLDSTRERDGFLQLQNIPSDPTCVTNSCQCISDVGFQSQIDDTKPIEMLIASDINVNSVSIDAINEIAITDDLNADDAQNICEDVSNTMSWEEIEQMVFDELQIELTDSFLECDDIPQAQDNASDPTGIYVASEVNVSRVSNGEINDFAKTDNFNADVANIDCEDSSIETPVLDKSQVLIETEMKTAEANIPQPTKIALDLTSVSLEATVPGVSIDHSQPGVDKIDEINVRSVTGEEINEFVNTDSFNNTGDKIDCLIENGELPNVVVIETGKITQNECTLTCLEAVSPQLSSNPCEFGADLERPNDEKKPDEIISTLEVNMPTITGDGKLGSVNSDNLNVEINHQVADAETAILDDREPILESEKVTSEENSFVDAPVGEFGSEQAEIEMEYQEVIEVDILQENSNNGAPVINKEVPIEVLSSEEIENSQIPVKVSEPPEMSYKEIQIDAVSSEPKESNIPLNMITDIAVADTEIFTECGSENIKIDQKTICVDYPAVVVNSLDTLIEDKKQMDIANTESSSAADQIKVDDDFQSSLPPEKNLKIFDGHVLRTVFSSHNENNTDKLEDVSSVQPILPADKNIELLTANVAQIVEDIVSNAFSDAQENIDSTLNILTDSSINGKSIEVVSENTLRIEGINSDATMKENATCEMEIDKNLHSILQVDSMITPEYNNDQEVTAVAVEKSSGPYSNDHTEECLELLGESELKFDCGISSEQALCVQGNAAEISAMVDRITPETISSTNDTAMDESVIVSGVKSTLLVDQDVEDLTTNIAHMEIEADVSKEYSDAQENITFASGLKILPADESAGIFSENTLQIEKNTPKENSSVIDVPQIEIDPNFQAEKSFELLAENELLIQDEMSREEAAEIVETVASFPSTSAGENVDQVMPENMKVADTVEKVSSPNKIFTDVVEIVSGGSRISPTDKSTELLDVENTASGANSSADHSNLSDETSVTENAVDKLKNDLNFQRILETMEWVAKEFVDVEKVSDLNADDSAEKLLSENTLQIESGSAPEDDVIVHVDRAGKVTKVVATPQTILPGDKSVDKLDANLQMEVSNSTQQVFTSPQQNNANEVASDPKNAQIEDGNIPEGVASNQDGKIDSGAQLILPVEKMMEISVGNILQKEQEKLATDFPSSTKNGISVPEKNYNLDTATLKPADITHVENHPITCNIPDVQIATMQNPLGIIKPHVVESSSIPVLGDQNSLKLDGAQIIGPRVHENISLRLEKLSENSHVDCTENKLENLLLARVFNQNYNQLPSGEVLKIDQLVLNTAPQICSRKLRTTENETVSIASIEMDFSKLNFNSTFVTKPVVGAVKAEGSLGKDGERGIGDLENVVVRPLPVEQNIYTISSVPPNTPVELSEGPTFRPEISAQIPIKPYESAKVPAAPVTIIPVESNPTFSIEDEEFISGDQFAVATDFQISALPKLRGCKPPRDSVLYQFDPFFQGHTKPDTTRESELACLGDVLTIPLHEAAKSCNDSIVDEVEPTDNYFNSSESEDNVTIREHDILDTDAPEENVALNKTVHVDAHRPLLEETACSSPFFSLSTKSTSTPQPTVQVAHPTLDKNQHQSTLELAAEIMLPKSPKIVKSTDDAVVPSPKTRSKSDHYMVLETAGLQRSVILSKDQFVIMPQEMPPILETTSSQFSGISGGDRAVLDSAEIPCHNPAVASLNVTRTDKLAVSGDSIESVAAIPPLEMSKNKNFHEFTPSVIENLCSKRPPTKSLSQTILEQTAELNDAKILLQSNSPAQTDVQIDAEKLSEKKMLGAIPKVGKKGGSTHSELAGVGLTIHQIMNRLASATEATEKMRLVEELESSFRVRQNQSQSKADEAKSSVERLKNKLKIDERMSENKIAAIHKLEIQLKNLTHENEMLREEKDEASNHLQSCVNALRDVEMKFERAKNSIFRYKENEESMLAQIDVQMVESQDLEKKYVQLKEQSTDQLNDRNGVYHQIVQEHESELLRLRTSVRCLELQLSSHDKELRQKTAEAEELNQLCDSLIAQISKH